MPPTERRLDLELIGKIQADLKQSGFGSEMIAVKEFLDAGWGTQGGAAFIDRDKGVAREFDLSAHGVYPILPTSIAAA